MFVRLIVWSIRKEYLREVLYDESRKRPKSEMAKS